MDHGEVDVLVEEWRQPADVVRALGAKEWSKQLESATMPSWAVSAGENEDPRLD